jgi:hypothetical protein
LVFNAECGGKRIGILEEEMITFAGFIVEFAVFLA